MPMMRRTLTSYSRASQRFFTVFRPRRSDSCYDETAMTRAHHLPLFHPRVVRERAKSIDAALFRAHQKTLGIWLAHLQSGALDAASEVELHGGFLERIFGDVLGYATFAQAKDGVWELAAERKVLSGGSADGALGFFSKDKRQARVIAPIELKGAATLLEHARGGARTPIQQGWDYANNAPESRWIIVSNYRETRLYAKSRGQAAYELFRLEELSQEEGFRRFVALLGRDALLGGPSPDRSPLSELLLASERTEREITERLYAKYREVRARVFSELLRRHSNLPADELLGYAQTILDRVLFLAFAEDRQLIPLSTIARAFEHRDPYHPRPIWQNFVAVFASVDAGNPALDIPRYNGGLFRRIPEIEELEISDETCAVLKELGDYDFAEDVSVDVLGHIFEQSITDLEQLRREASTATSVTTPPLPSTGTQKAPSKRKVEGIFYTPPFITSYLVRQTVGQVIADAWERAGVDRVTKKAERIAAWEDFQSQLRRIRVLDPSCGSGAFLIAAFDLLAQQFDRANRVLSELRGHRAQTTFFDLTRTVLNENLFGVDKSAESVEITKLSLWLKTAERGKQLTFLDRNIRHGNSVVSDPRVDPWAFDWGAGRVAHAFRESAPPEGEDDAERFDARWREGFDVVLGNPPYVRQELLSQYKDHFQTAYRAYDGMADLFVYFFERGLQQLKTGGRLGFIVSNKWLRGGYAEKLRSLFARECTITSLVDFGHAPIFPDADAFPCILTLRKLAPRPNHTVQVTLFPREELGKEALPSYVDTHQFPLPQSTLSGPGWTLEPPSVQALLSKLRERGTPLAQYTKLKPYRGVLTGLNEAFLVDHATKERLCREDPRSAKILKKYLRGQDISRWSPEWAQNWLLLIPSSGDHAWPWSACPDESTAEHVFAQTYPAVYRHLKPLEGKLRPRQDQGRFFWELRACAYYELFERPKLIYQEIQFHPAYAVDHSGFYLNNKGFLLPSEDAWLLAVLNSPAMWWHNWRYLVHLKDEALTPAADKLMHVPIPEPGAAQRRLVTEQVGEIIERTAKLRRDNAAVLDVLRMEYEVSEPGQALLDLAALDSDAFVQAVKKHRGKGGKRLTPDSLSALRQLYDSAVPGLVAGRAEILVRERSLAAQVHAAYGLSAEDLELLAQTAPPRMPPGFSA